MTSVLHLDDVSLHRGSHQILSHVSWTVEEGQHDADRRVEGIHGGQP